VGAQWKTLDEAVKSSFLAQAAQSKETAKATKSTFLSSLTDKQSMLVSLLNKTKKISSGSATRRILTAEERQFYETFPKNPPKSAYMLFMKEKLGQSGAKGKTPLEIRAGLKAIAEEWKSLGSFETQRYEERLQALKRGYEEEMNRFTEQISTK
jgi:hypothetical protein